MFEICVPSRLHQHAYQENFDTGLNLPVAVSLMMQRDNGPRHIDSVALERWMSQPEAICTSGQSTFPRFSGCKILPPRVPLLRALDVSTKA
jgi:hypothetical protein